MTRVGVLDYGSGNLHSACRALEAAGAEVVLSSDHDALRRCDKLLLPGVGAFAACMEGLRAVGGDEFVTSWHADRRPLLGICVGHQVLFTAGFEHDVEATGLGLLPGMVQRLESARLPHMGWNQVEAAEGSKLFEGIEDERFYFVHSYGVRAQQAEHLMPAGARTTWASHGGDRFVAAVEHENISSLQFHPEKSGASGAALLQGWVNA